MQQDSFLCKMQGLEEYYCTARATAMKKLGSLAYISRSVSYTGRSELVLDLKLLYSILALSNADES